MLSTSKLFYNPSAGGATDPYFKYVPLLLETTSTNGQQNNTFLDSSTNNFTITRNGTPTQGSVTPYWPNGYWSNYFGGSADFANGSSASLAFGTGNFTFEAWVNVGSTSAAGGVISTLPSAGGPGIGIIVLTGGTVNAAIGNSGTASNYTSASALTVGSWNHVAFVRSGSTVTLYINGASVASGTNASSIVTTDFIVGRGYTNLAAAYFNGYISNVRITNTAVYTGAFTPSTTPLTAVTGTILLTSQSNRFKDNSASPLTVTPGGSPKVQAFQPFSPPASYTAAAYGASGYFNGSTDLITTPNATALQLNGTSWTIECYVYLTASTAAYKTIISKRSGATAEYELGIDPSGFFYYYTTAVLSSTFSVPVNAWTHLAVTCDGTNTYMFANGVLVKTNAGTTAASGTAALNMGNGYVGNNQWFPGYTSNVRIIKGQALSTTTFTPPTAPVTTSTVGWNGSSAALSGTVSFLANCTNAGIYDAAVQNNQITVGSAQASTTVAKWSPTSMKFNGTTDYLDLGSNPAFVMGSGDWTVEGWVYPTSTSAGHWMYLQGNASAFAAIRIGCQSNQVFLLISTNGTTNTVSSGLVGTVPINNWTYIAVTRSGTTVTLYVNGTSVYTSTALGTSALMTGTYNLVGRIDPTNLQYFTGYLQDVRLTKGYARTITTPTAAFPTR